MTVMSIGSAPSAPGALRPETGTRVIDLDTIRSILYLGLKGGVALGGPAGGPPMEPRRSARSGVDTYA